MDLEQEFQKLMDEAVQKVQAKQAAGELSDVQADDLIDIIATRRQKGARAWSYSDNCYTDEDDDSYDSDDRGWSKSSWCGDNG